MGDASLNHTSNSQNRSTTFCYMGNSLNEGPFWGRQTLYKKGPKRDPDVENSPYKYGGPCGIVWFCGSATGALPSENT